MSFGIKWYEKLFSAVLVVLIAGYIIGSIMFFIDMRSLRNDYNSDRKSINTNITILDSSIKTIQETSDNRIRAFNYRFDKLNDSNAIQHKQLNDELKRFEYVMLKGNKQMMNELKDLRNIQQNISFVTQK